MALLEGPSAKQAEIIKQELGENAGDLESGIRDLRSMCAANPYLPPPQALDSSFLALFLRGCRMNFERARNKLELYCCSRSRSRDFYEYRSLNEPPLNDVCKFIDIVPLPKLTDEGYRVTIFRVKAGYPECSADISTVVRAILLIADCRMHDETLILGDVFIWEVTHMRISVAARLAASANVIRRAMHLAHAAYPQRMRRIHIVGAPVALASSLNLIRSWGSEKIRQRFQLHSKVEELLDYYPAKVLPAEWGGKEKSIDELFREWRHRVEDLREYLRELNEMCQETPDKNYNNDIYGTVGSFRKLDID